MDFNQPESKSWKSCGGYSGMIIRKDFDATTPAGNFENLIEIFFDIPEALDDEFVVIFAPGVGIINKTAFFGTRMTLTSYQL